MTSEYSSLLDYLKVPLIAGTATLFALKSLRRIKLQNDFKERDSMHVPVYILVIGVVVLSLFIAAAVLSQLYPDVDSNGVAEADWRYALAFFAFSLMGVPLVLAYFFERYLLASDKICYRTPLNKGVLLYNDIVAVDYLKSSNSFVLKGKNGDVVRVAIMLTNIQEFARIVLMKVSSECIDEPTRCILNETAAGNPPSLYGI